MENASKALIIAGAILLSILIIGLGVYFFSAAREIIPDNPLGSVEIQQFNGQFIQYEGTNVSGSKVKTLLNTVRSHNSSQEDETRRVGIESTAGTFAREAITAANVSTVSASIKTGKTYLVELIYDDNTSLVSSIKITEK